MNSITVENPTEGKTVCQVFVKDAGLGNQMFEWAAGYGIAKRLNMNYIWSWKPTAYREFGLIHFGIENTEHRVPVEMNRAGQGNIELVRKAESIIKKSQHRTIGICCPFQAEECFSDYADDIRKIFRLDPYPLNVPYGCTPVAVQARRGDYVGHSRLDVVTVDYFKNAMKWMRDKIENPHFFFVSDDPTWCRHTFGHFPNVTIMPEQAAIDGLRTMIACDAHIISNSTFGWWGAWLGEKGPVVVPEIWHHKPGSYGKWNPIPERWNRVEVGLKPTIEVIPLKPEEITEPKHDRAIVYPWKAEAAVWQELRFSLRSVHENFEDKECPIYILGTQRPPWLLYKDHRVKFLPIWGYREALVTGLQLAEKVLWMNDDITMVNPVTWADCEKTRYLKKISPDFLTTGPQENAWREGCLKILRDLKKEGITDHKVFSTHTPYVFEREKSLEILKKYGAWEKMPFELAYFHHAVKKPVLLKNVRTETENFGDSLYLNYSDRTITPQLREAVKQRFPNYAPWELQAVFAS